MGFPRFAVRFCTCMRRKIIMRGRPTAAPPPRARARVRGPKLRACADLDTPTSYTRTRRRFLVRVRKIRHAPCKPVKVKTFEDFPTISKKISRFLKRFPDFSKISQRFPRFLEDFQDFPRFLKDFQDFSKISGFPAGFPDFLRDFR